MEEKIYNNGNCFLISPPILSETYYFIVNFRTEKLNEVNLNSANNNMTGLLTLL